MTTTTTTTTTTATGPCPCCRRPGVPADRLVNFAGVFRSRAASIAYVCEACRGHVRLTIDPARAIHAHCPLTGHYTS